MKKSTKKIVRSLPYDLKADAALYRFISLNRGSNEFLNQCYLDINEKDSFTAWKLDLARHYGDYSLDDLYLLLTNGLKLHHLDHNFVLKLYGYQDLVYQHAVEQKYMLKSDQVTARSIEFKGWLSKATYSWRKGTLDLNKRKLLKQLKVSKESNLKLIEKRNVALCKKYIAMGKPLQWRASKGPNEEEKIVHHFCGGIRKRYNKGLLSPSEIKKYMDIGIIEEKKPSRYAFEEIYRDLQAFAQEHGHCSPTKSYEGHGDIGYRVRRLRERYKIGEVRYTKKQVAQLKDLGFSFSPGTPHFKMKAKMVLALSRKVTDFKEMRGWQRNWVVYHRCRLMKRRVPEDRARVLSKFPEYIFPKKYFDAYDFA